MNFLHFFFHGIIILQLDVNIVNLLNLLFSDNLLYDIFITHTCGRFLRIFMTADMPYRLFWMFMSVH